MSLIHTELISMAQCPTAGFFKHTSLRARQVLAWHGSGRVRDVGQPCHPQPRHPQGSEVWYQENRFGTLCGPPSYIGCFVRLELKNSSGALFYGGMLASGIHHRWRTVIVGLQLKFGFLPHFLCYSGRWRRSHLFPHFAYLSLTSSCV